MDENTRRRIADQRDEEFTPEERQELRFVKGEVIHDMVPSSEIRDAHQKIADLYGVLGFIPAMKKIWRQLALVAVVAVFLGGQEFIGRIAAMLQGWLP